MDVYDLYELGQDYNFSDEIALMSDNYDHRWGHYTYLLGDDIFDTSYMAVDEEFEYPKFKQCMLDLGFTFNEFSINEKVVFLIDW